MEFKFVINADNWTIGQYVEFIEATQNGNIRQVVESVPSLIESWSLPGDPKDVKYLMNNVKLSQWRAITKELARVLVDVFETPKQ